MKYATSAPILWLLGKLLRGTHRESLVGDLVEQRALGRSALWFWRQVLVAIAADVGHEVKVAWGALVLVALFVGFGAATLLGVVKTMPDWALADAALAAFGAAWLVSRFGGFAGGLVFAALVALLKSPPVYAAVMAVFDHFGGLWWLTHHGMRALPESLTVTTLCCLAGAVLGACPPRTGPVNPEPATQ